jgi:hypothetical protein
MSRPTTRRSEGRSATGRAYARPMMNSAAAGGAASVVRRVGKGAPFAPCPPFPVMPDDGGHATGRVRVRLLCPPYVRAH